jgi:hypothetical protein
MLKMRREKKNERERKKESKRSLKLMFNRVLIISFILHKLFIHLCGTATKIWLRHVQEDLSLTACLEHSAISDP